MKTKRVAMLSVHACPIAAEEGKETGGLNVYVLELSQALASSQITLDLYTRSQNPRQPKIKSITSGVRVIHLPAGPQKPYPKNQVRRHLPEFVSHFLDFTQKQGISYDIFHSHYYLSGLAGQAIRRRLDSRCPHIITFHTLGYMKNLVAHTARDREEPGRITAEANLIKHTAHTIATSSADADLLTYLYGCPRHKISVIPPGVNTSLFSPIEKPRAKQTIGAIPSHAVILAVGRIEPVKGFDVLLYAVKILVQRNPKLKGKACVWIVGGDTSQQPADWSAELKYLQGLRHQLGLSSVVKFVGQQPQRLLPAYYAAADVLIMPSHYESFGMVALEAMACGTPVIATDVSGISRIIGEQFEQLVTSANNPLLLASQLENIVTRRGDTRALAHRLRQRALAFDWKVTAAKTLAVYQKMAVQAEVS